MRAKPTAKPARGRPTVLDVDALVRQMDKLAQLTWERVAFAEQGFSFREDSITEHNLFELARRHPQLLVQRFNATEEAANGADWEWWIGGPRQGWVGIRVQAKKMSPDGTYHEISHMTGHRQRQRQYDVLINSCLEDEARFAAPILPLYCFYNGWNGLGRMDPEWPDDTQNAACPNGYLPPECSHIPNIRYFGCAISSALDVAAVHQGPHGSRTTLNGHLTRSRPWSHLFHRPEQVGTPTAPGKVSTTVLSQVEVWLSKSLEGQPATNNPNYGRLLETARRPPSQELPNYASALLDGRLPRDVDWPEATFVAVLDVEESRQIPK